MFAAWCVWQSLRGAAPQVRWFAVATLIASPVVFVAAGSVMTDAAQLAVIGVCMLCGFKALQAGPHGAWRYGFWAALGVGLLAKGLATAALIGLPVLAYALWTRQFGEIWRKLGGALPITLSLLIGLPWYWLAEKNYPGFLKYFIWGEHFQRFLDPGWQGDRYGVAHLEPLGTIWLFVVAGMAPWIWPLLGRLVLQQTRTRRTGSVSNAERWWWAWAVTPIIFFTFAHNIIWTYALTAGPAFAVLAAKAFEQSGASRQARLVRIAAGVTVAVGLALAIALPARIESHSARQWVADMKRLDPSNTLQMLFFRSFPFSAAVYSQGQARQVDDLTELRQRLKASRSFVVAPQADVQSILADPNVRLVREQGGHALLRADAP